MSQDTSKYVRIPIPASQRTGAAEQYRSDDYWNIYVGENNTILKQCKGSGKILPLDDFRTDASGPMGVSVFSIAYQDGEDEEHEPFLNETGQLEFHPSVLQANPNRPFTYQDPCTGAWAYRNLHGDRLEWTLEEAKAAGLEPIRATLSTKHIYYAKDRVPVVVAKQCPCCHKIKSLNGFSSHRSSKSPSIFNIQGRCRVCASKGKTIRGTLRSETQRKAAEKLVLDAIKANYPADQPELRFDDKIVKVKVFDEATNSYKVVTGTVVQNG